MEHISDIQAISSKLLSLCLGSGESILSPLLWGEGSGGESKQSSLQRNLAPDIQLLQWVRGPRAETLVSHFEMWGQWLYCPEPSTEGETEIVYFNASY